MTDPGSHSASRPRVSVVIPAYNAARYLRRSVGSALAQTLPDLEVIVVDDGSSDATSELALALAAADPRVRLLRNESNLGVSVARNRGIEAARGEWVAFLDADDAFLPERLDRLLAAGEDADVVSDDVYRVEADGTTAWSTLRRRPLPPLELDAPRWLRAADVFRYHLGILVPAVRRRFLQQQAVRFEPTLSIHEDGLFCLDLLLHGARWLQVPEGYYLYYPSAGSLTVGTPLAAQWPLVSEAFAARLASPRVIGDAAAADSIRAFLEAERVSMLFLGIRDAVQRRDLAAAAGLYLTHPEAWLPLVGRVVVHARASAGRRRNLVRVLSDADGRPCRLTAAHE